MTKRLMIYEEATPVSPDLHGDLSVELGENYDFARRINAVPLTVTEFRPASAEYAIVFTGTETPMPAAVLGAHAGRNAFVGDYGGWQARYVPAFIRQYPFVLAGAEDTQKLTLCIDETFDGCNRDGAGERLFDETGQKTDFMNDRISLLRAYQEDYSKTRAFCAKLKELDLLTSMKARLPGTKNAVGLPQPDLAIEGFSVVDEERLNSQSDKALGELCRNGILMLVHTHILSLDRMGRLGGSGGA